LPLNETEGIPFNRIFDRDSFAREYIFLKILVNTCINKILYITLCPKFNKFNLISEGKNL